MELRSIDKADILAAMRRNGTREEVVTDFDRRAANTGIGVATDGRFTIVTDGYRVGVAKRNTYARTRDKDNPDIGLAIAASRL